MLPLLLASHTTLRPQRVQLVTFDGARGTSFSFTELNDPVMGGRSRGSWHVNSTYGVLDGEVVDIPSLKVPGFIKAAADGSFRDASSAGAGSLELLLRTTTPEYAGFRVAIASGTLAPAYACAGGGSIPLSRGCYKAKFVVPPGSGWSRVSIPFAAFSDRWSPATGERTSECSDDPSACLTAERLGAIRRIELWAEGANGAVHLECLGIAAVAGGDSQAMPTRLALEPVSAARSIRPASAFDSCSAAVQPALRFGISGRGSPDVPVPVDAGETLAEAVCCDTRARAYAEPQFLFSAPDIALFSKLAPSGPTTFYDSVCGLPLFRAPVNRSLDDFRRDTQEHGWPSFRLAEVVDENVVTDASTGLVRSRCGTHLGTYLPDERGARWCMDLACIAGQPSRVDVA